MIIVRSSFPTVYFLGGHIIMPPLARGSDTRITIIGSTKMLAEFSKKYDITSSFIVADYGNYVFVNRCASVEENTCYWAELELLKTGIKYDVMLKVRPQPYREIVSATTNIPVLEIDGLHSGRWCYPVEVIPKLDEMFTSRPNLEEENKRLKEIIKQMEDVINQ